MIVVLASPAAFGPVRDLARRAGVRCVADSEVSPSRVALVGALSPAGRQELADALEAQGDIDMVIRDPGPAPLASRHFRPSPSAVVVGSVSIGGGAPVFAAGPCAVESREQLLEVARAAASVGAGLLRGGAFKPRTSPYAFQGLGPEGLRLLAEARAETGLPVATEVLAPEQVELVAEYADMLQVGARNMQNFALLAAVGAARKPVLLKRGMGATLDEWLMAAEYLIATGASGVVLCERGLRHFDPHTRNVFDLAGAVAVRSMTHLPVIADPSHATGHRELVAPLALAALVSGLDGVIVEVHPDPDRALSDGPQSLDLDGLRDLASRIAALGVDLAQPSKQRRTATVEGWAGWR
jgi:3-deoxy-7-phosphoheptulonate synthase